MKSVQKESHLYRKTQNAIGIENMHVFTKIKIKHKKKSTKEYTCIQKLWYLQNKT